MHPIERALAIALQAHQGQVDKSGQPYILHPIRIMMRLNDDRARVTAILHDVIEDSNITFDDLVQAGFDSEIIEALKCLTRAANEDYYDYILRVKKNQLARKVKLADLKDNLDASRLKTLHHKDCQRMERYLSAMKILREEKEI